MIFSGGLENFYTRILTCNTEHGCDELHMFSTLQPKQSSAYHLPCHYHYFTTRPAHFSLFVLPPPPTSKAGKKHPVIEKTRNQFYLKHVFSIHDHVREGGSATDSFEI